MKKLWTMAVILAMLTGTISGCGSSNNTSGKTSNDTSGSTSGNTSGNTSADTSGKTSADASGNSSEPAAPQETAKIDEPVKLKVWMYGVQGQKDTDVALEAYNEILSKAIPNTTIEVYFPTDMAKEYNLAMAAKEQIDMSWTGWTTDLTKEAKDGNLLPLDELLEEYGKDIIESLGKDVLTVHKLSYDGKLYQVPTYQGLCGTVASVFPMEIVGLMRDGWTEEFDKTCDELFWNYSIEVATKQYDLIEEYCATAKANDKLGNGINPGYLKSYCMGWPDRSGVYKNYLFGLTPNDNTFTANSRFEEGTLYYEALKLQYSRMADWYKKGYISADISATTADNKIWEGPVSQDSFISAHTTYTSSLEDALKDFAQKTKSDVIGFKTLRAWQSDLGTATGMSIPYTSKYPEKAMLLINEMYSNAELYNTWCYGKKDTHWKDNGDGSISLLHDFTGEPTSEWPYGQYTWTFGNKLLLYGLEKDWVNPVSYDDKHLPVAYNMPLCGFIMDISSVEDQYSNAVAIFGEYDMPLSIGIYGDEWEEKFNEMITEMNKIGMDNMLEEFNKQIHETLSLKKITSWNLDKSKYEQEKSPLVVEYKPAN